MKNQQLKAMEADLDAAKAKISAIHDMIFWDRSVPAEAYRKHIEDVLYDRKNTRADHVDEIYEDATELRW